MLSYKKLIFNFYFSRISFQYVNERFSFYNNLLTMAVKTIFTNL